MFLEFYFQNWDPRFLSIYLFLISLIIKGKKKKKKKKKKIQNTWLICLSFNKRKVYKLRHAEIWSTWSKSVDCDIVDSSKQKRFSRTAFNPLSGNIIDMAFKSLSPSSFFFQFFEIFSLIQWTKIADLYLERKKEN